MVDAMRPWVMTQPRPARASIADIGPRTAEIAGATGNVGQATATELTRRGYRVVTLRRSRAKLERHARSALKELRHEAEAQGGDLVPLQVDLTNLESMRQAANSIIDRFGAVDLLVLSAVTHTKDGPTLLPHGNEPMFSTNVLGPFRPAMLLKPALESARGYRARRCTISAQNKLG